MTRWYKTAALAVFIAVFFMNQDNGCHDDASRRDSEQQSKMMLEAQAQAGLPAIHHFQEKKLLKMIYELRDQEGLPTWVYLQGMSGHLVYIGRAIGFGIPYSAQYTSPTSYYSNRPQAEPNGIFMPSSAEGTWLLMLDRNGDPHPVYFEPRVVVSPFPLPVAKE